MKKLLSVLCAVSMLVLPACGGDSGENTFSGGLTSENASHESSDAVSSGNTESAGGESTGDNESVAGSESTTGSESAVGSESTAGNESAAGNESTGGNESAGGGEQSSPEDTAKYEEALAKFLEDTKTDSFVIVLDGEEIFSYYRTAQLETQKANIFSAGKSVSSVVFGIAMDMGYFSPEDPITKYITEDFGDTDKSALDKITVRNLLTMTSGFDDLLNLKYETGEDWVYSDAWNLLFTILEKTTEQTVNEFADAYLFDKLGMDDTEYRSSAAGLALMRGGKPVLSSWNPQQIHCTATDLAKFGEFILHGGTVNGERLISEEYLSEALTPCGQNPAYGYLFWLNENSGGIQAGTGDISETNIIPNAPKDTVSALGAADKKLYVVPSLDLVAVRIGKAANDEKYAFTQYDNELWEQINIFLEGCGY